MKINFTETGYLPQDLASIAASVALKLMWTPYGVNIAITTGGVIQAYLGQLKKSTRSLDLFKHTDETCLVKKRYVTTDVWKIETIATHQAADDPCLDLDKSLDYSPIHWHHQVYVKLFHGVTPTSSGVWRQDGSSMKTICIATCSRSGGGYRSILAAFMSSGQLFIYPDLDGSDAALEDGHIKIEGE